MDPNLFSRNSQAIMFNYKEAPVQRMLDFDYLCKRNTPSVAAVVTPGSEGNLITCHNICNHKLYMTARRNIYFSFRFTSRYNILFNIFFYMLCMQSSPMIYFKY